MQRATCSVQRARARSALPVSLRYSHLRPAFRPKLTPAIEVQEVRHSFLLPLHSLVSDAGLPFGFGSVPIMAHQDPIAYQEYPLLSKRNHRSLHETILFSAGQSQNVF